MKTNLSRHARRANLPALLLFFCCSAFTQAQTISSPSLVSGVTNRSLSPQTATQNSTTPVDKEIVVFGTKIHYVEAGSGPVVILLHGLGGSTQNWVLNIPVLAQKFRVIVPDQIGFGKSDKPFINYRIGTYV